MTHSATARGIRFLVAALALSFASIVSWMAVRHGFAEYWGQSTQPALWQRALQLEPDNPENWYRLGRYHQVDFEHTDLSEAVRDYAQAASMAPGSAQYWMGLAEAREAAMQLDEAEKAFRQAERAYPLSADVAWRFGNFLLRQDRQQEAYLQVHRALSVQPSLTALAISRCWQSSHDISRILKFALPAEPEAYWGAIDFLTEAREPDAAMVVWKALMASNPTFELTKSFHFQDMLIDAERAQDVLAVWQQSLSAAGVTSDSSHSRSILWNGGFEQELLNGGLGWRFRKVAGAELTFDRGTSHSGVRSLRVDLDGSENIDLQQPMQYVVLQPNTRYRVAAYFRTENLLTSTGVHLELQEKHFGNRVAFSADLPENQEWTPSEFEFTTGPDTKLFRLVLRRSLSSKIANKIHGTVWIDDIAMTPIVESSELR